jgi:sugar lactone lactonase YvrE
MRQAGVRAALLVVAAVALALPPYFAWPAAEPPAAWHPSPLADVPGPRNEALAGAERIPLGGAHGPEDVAFGPDGALYTGVADGRILRRRPDGSLDTVARTGGRPLGLRFGGDGRLYVADAARGLLAMGRDGSVEVLVREHGHRPFRLTDDLDVAADGTVYFTDASTRVGLGDAARDVVEQYPTGRLFSWQAGTGVRLLHGRLAFANGVALDRDERSVLVAETARYRVQRCWLRGDRAGRCDVFADNLPGFPDGVTRGRDGLFWVALVSPRNALLDRVHPHPRLKTALLRLPDALRPGPRAYGRVLGLGEDGRVVHDLHDPSGGAAAFVTNAVEHAGRLYLGSLESGWIARVPVP